MHKRILSSPQTIPQLWLSHQSRVIRPRIFLSHRRFSSASPITLKSRDNDKTSLHTLLSMKGKTTVITGGGRGIGLSLASQVAELGGDIAVLDSLPEPHEDFNQLEKAFGIKARYYRTDVTQEVSLTGSFNEVVKEFGTIDGCVTCAGIVFDKPFLETEWDDLAKVQNVNIAGTYFSAQLAAKQMQKQGRGGSIVMIASICAHQTLPEVKLSAYTASKGAIKALGHSLAVELGPENIRINTISPGYIYTAMTEAQIKAYPQVVALYHSDPPLRRMGFRKDLNGAVAYYLSDISSYVTGTDLIVSGGLHVGRSNPSELAS